MTKKDDLVGKVITDDFKLVRQIGFGGYARVYLARQISVGGRQVAVKVLHSMHVKDGARASMDSLKREAGYLAMLTSPVFPRIIRTGTVPGGLPFFAMEFVRGKSIEAVLKQGGPMSPALAVVVVDAVLDGLTEMHGRDIIHRDIKTGNIALDETVPGTCRVRMFDLGSAKPAYSGDAASFSATNLQPGSPPYLAPETAAKGVTGELSDIYSLGVVAYEMLCGMRAIHIKETNPEAFLEYLRSDSPIPTHRIATVQPDVPESIEAVLAKAMARNPRDRFQSAWEFRRALREAARDVTDLTALEPGMLAARPPGKSSAPAGALAGISGLFGRVKKSLGLGRE